MSRWFLEYGFDRVDEGLLVGAVPLDADDAATIVDAGATRVLSLVRDEEYAPGRDPAVPDAYAAAGVEEVRAGSPDFGNLRGELIEDASARVADWLAGGETVYVHCRAGWQRSSVVAAAALARRDDVPPGEALRRVREGRPEARPLPHQVDDLERWWRARAADGSPATVGEGAAGVAGEDAG